MSGTRFDNQPLTRSNMCWHCADQAECSPVQAGWSFYVGITTAIMLTTDSLHSPANTTRPAWLRTAVLNHGSMPLPIDSGPRPCANVAIHAVHRCSSAWTWRLGMCCSLLPTRHVVLHVSRGGASLVCVRVCKSQAVLSRVPRHFEMLGNSNGSPRLVPVYSTSSTSLPFASKDLHYIIRCSYK
ncbi:hypothetical protein LIA77_05456 [Sarocladium implicatum]|nr:hypothetical protein LIA77_05456 [Sarocladium implicatum]